MICVEYVYAQTHDGRQLEDCESTRCCLLLWVECMPTKLNVYPCPQRSLRCGVSLLGTGHGPTLNESNSSWLKTATMTSHLHQAQHKRILNTLWHQTYLARSACEIVRGTVETVFDFVAELIKIARELPSAQASVVRCPGALMRCMEIQL